MKKAIFILMLAGTIYSCGSDKKKDIDKAADNANMSAVPNVNGNIPDTTNSINLDSHKKDTTAKKDSM